MSAASYRGLGWGARYRGLGWGARTNASIVVMLALIHVAGVRRYFQTITISIKSSQESSFGPAATADDINIVSLTTSSDFYVLFNNSAIASWIRHIRNVKSITFIGRPVEEEEFWGNMAIHYPQFPTDQTPGTKNSSHQFADGVLPMPTVYWANETHWIEKYMKPYMDENKMPCPYWKVCQQLIKLHVFELSTELGHGYLGDNILIVDSGK